MAKFAIDLHGGDFGPSVLIPSCFNFFRRNPQHIGMLVGNISSYRSYVQNCPSNIEWVDAQPIGQLIQKPSRMIRQDGNSSIEVCFRLLQKKQADGLVSAEHTGVLLVLMSKYGQMHHLVHRAVLASWLPTLNQKPSVMLDLGASYTAKHDQLLVYAAIGVGLTSQYSAKPKLSLLNVGTEFFKGPRELRLADKAIQSWGNVDYIGFIEASDVFLGLSDVIVCDGFTGNSIIKSAEGALGLTFDLLKRNLSGGFVSKLVSIWLKVQMSQTLKRLDPKSSNGAIVAGSDLLVVKSHGNAKEKAFFSAMQRMVDAHEDCYIDSIARQLDHLAASKIMASE